MIIWVSSHIIGDQKDLKATNEDYGTPQTKEYQPYVYIKIVIINQICDMVSSFLSQIMLKTYKNSMRVKKSVQACGKVICGVYFITKFYFVLQSLLLVYIIHLVLDNIIK